MRKLNERVRNITRARHGYRKSLFERNAASVFALDVVDLMQHAFRVADEFFAVRRQRHARGVALEDRDAEIRFQFLDAAAQIRRRNEQLPRGLVERSDPCNLHRIFHVKNVHVSSLRHAKRIVD